jgi:outer membrane protein assembly factor BamB
MRRRTVLALVAVCGLLGGIAVFGLGAASGGDLTERWVSDTPRDNDVNHHAVGVGPAGEVIVAPVAEVPHSDVPITNTSCALVRLGPGDGTTVWRAGLPAEDCFTHALTEPAIADVDGDGRLEAVVASTEDALVAHAAADGAEGWRVPLSTYGYGRPTVANVTAAPGPEVVTSDIQGGVVVADGNGTVAWRFALNATGWSTVSVWQAPAVADLDADDVPEVLVGSSEGPLVLSAGGAVEWQRDGEATYTATARIDDDPAVEVVTAGTTTVRAYDGRTGAVEWGRDLTNARFRTAADGDGDGTVELYVGRVGGSVLALDARTGETEWSTTVSGSGDTIVPPPVLGDVDGDGGPEVVATLDSGTVAVLDAGSGRELAAYSREVPVWTFPTVDDVDDDGSAEILVRYGDGRVVALDYAAGQGLVPGMAR